ncbi:hypothetical protein B0H11DRAFT_1921521 [Mycena galericulata]|nr:hypothetical protein B0H11DRAFT_1921521 [Mycena galericulata]
MSKKRTYHESDENGEDHVDDEGKDAGSTPASDVSSSTSTGSLAQSAPASENLGDTPEDLLEETVEEFDGDILAYSGRSRPKVELQNPHLECSTHFLRVCSPISRKVPVPLGPAMPRRDMDDLKQKYSRLMLILFKPWHHAQDLCKEGFARVQGQQRCSLFPQAKS